MKTRLALLLALLALLLPASVSAHASYAYQTSWPCNWNGTYQAVPYGPSTWLVCYPSGYWWVSHNGNHS